MKAAAILTYHSLDASGSVLSVAPQVFARQMDSLAAAGFRAASVARVAAHLREHGAWPQRTVGLSFDDGYANLHGEARPVLERHGFTASVYLVTDHVGGSNDWETPPARLGRQAILSWAQVADLAAAGWEIGGHTRSHPDLRACAGADLEREILGCRDALVAQVAQPTPTFAYPFGHATPQARALVQRAFAAGCTTVLARARHGDPLHSLPRVDMYYFRHAVGLAGLVEGRRDAYLAVRRLGRRVRAALRG